VTAAELRLRVISDVNSTQLDTPVKGLAKLQRIASWPDAGQVLVGKIGADRRDDDSGCGPDFGYGTTSVTRYFSSTRAPWLAITDGRVAEMKMPYGVPALYDIAAYWVRLYLGSPVRNGRLNKLR
jgi:hypothetical protein